MTISSSPRRKTKIVCTIGPASASPQKIRRLLQAGMNVARLNFSHGSYEAHSQYIHTLRETAAALDLPVAIMQDLPGRKPRLGDLSRPEIRVNKGDRLTLTTLPSTSPQLFINLPDLPQKLPQGAEILLGDGAIRLKVEDSGATEVRCRVMNRGKIRSRMGVAFPGLPLEGPFLTSQDQKHISFGIEHKVDFIALSFVSRAEDIAEAKNFLKARGADIPVIAKIEKAEGVRNLAAILSLADGIIVARGDLGVETPLTRVPIVQKEIIQECNHAGKPVITATQMLESMIHSPSPTRAEATDVANAIMDGSDALLLSAETSIGRYPVAATTIMGAIAEETEAALPYQRLLAQKGADLEPRTDDAISYAACHIAQQLGAQAIIAFTFSGSTAWRVSKYRPQVPILALTPNAITCIRLALAWGVYPFQAEEPSNLEQLFPLAVEVAIKQGVAKRGDLIVITAGIPLGIPGTTNLLKVERVP